MHFSVERELTKDNGYPASAELGKVREMLSGQYQRLVAGEVQI